MDTAVAGTVVNSKAVVYGAAGEVNATKLQVGGVDITSTPAELNLLDNVAGLVQGDFTKLAAVDTTAVELNYVGGVTSAIQTQLDDKISLTGISATDNGGDGSFSYNNTTGEFSYTGPSAAEVRAHFDGTENRISVTDGAVDIASTYIGQDSITTLGTIATGTWNGSVIASAYLDADTAHLSGTQTFTGAKTFSDTTASTTKTTGAVIVTGGVGISGALNVGGDVVAYASSDERLKDNIELISNPIEKVQQLKGVTWDWNDNADELQKSLPNVGVIAQDVEKVLPQLVKDRDNGFKGVDYDKLVGLLIEAVKDQQTQIDELKAQIK